MKMDEVIYETGQIVDEIHEAVSEAITLPISKEEISEIVTYEKRYLHNFEGSRVAPVLKKLNSNYGLDFPCE